MIETLKILFSYKLGLKYQIIIFLVSISDKTDRMSTLGASLTLAGERKSGQDVRTQNVMAASSIANIVKSSLGPVGLDKMMVDEVGDVTITNDGATILQLLEVEHPAAKVLVELAALQDEEVGDGTTSVVIIAAELLKNADELVKQKIHPTSIIAGYRLAMKESVKYIKEHLTYKVKKIGHILTVKFLPWIFIRLMIWERIVSSMQPKLACPVSSLELIQSFSQRWWWRPLKMSRSLTAREATTTPSRPLMF